MNASQTLLITKRRIQWMWCPTPAVIPGFELLTLLLDPAEMFNQEPQCHGVETRHALSLLEHGLPALHPGVPIYSGIT